MYKGFLHVRRQKTITMWIIGVLLITTNALGNAQDFSIVEPASCSIVQDTAETLFQLRQGGFDLGEADINQTELTAHEVLLLTDMIEDIKKMPVYQLKQLKDQALQNFIQKWNKTCEARHLEGQNKI